MRCPTYYVLLPNPLRVLHIPSDFLFFTWSTCCSPCSSSLQYSVIISFYIGLRRRSSLLLCIQLFSSDFNHHYLEHNHGKGYAKGAIGYGEHFPRFRCRRGVTISWSNQFDQHMIGLGKFETKIAHLLKRGRQRQSKDCQQISTEEQNMNYERALLD